MASIPEEVIEQVRKDTNIADVIGQYVQLKKSGNNLFGLCPFQEERTPSFSVSESKQIYHCFSCGRGGSVFNFLMELEGLSFKEAVVKVADFSHIQLPENIQNTGNEGESKESTANQQLIELHEQAAKLYHHILVNTEMGEQALDYLHDRGLDDEIISTYNLGFAPDKRLLLPFFQERKSDFQLLRQSGLFIENQEGQLRDRFAGRVMFPIRNQSGKTIAFSGRMLVKADNSPKYLNSPETTIFNKRKVLFNFDIARGASRQTGSVTLFEGFMDVIAAYRAGIKNGIASMGTSLTSEQIYAIERITQKLVICYDGDDPGQEATNRAISLFSNQQRLTLNIVQIPEKLDPDEFLKKYGAEKFQELVTSAIETPISFKMRFLKRNRNLENESDQLEYINDVLQVLATVSSPVEQDLYLNQLANNFGLDKSTLKRQLASIVPAKAQPERQQRQVAPVTPEVTYEQPRKLDKVERAERNLLYRMLHDQSVWLKVTGMSEFHFIHDDYQSIFLLAEGYFAKHQNQYDSASFIDFIREKKLQQLIVALELSQMNVESDESEIDDYLHVIMKQAPLEHQLAELQRQLADAVRLGDTSRERELTFQIIKVQQQKQREKQA
ncbi:DNA primase [Secundilactobacillus oryzae JCM 18671]|uniref:DNA primase n=1 Tax=Secundilactobacillus oryzae JCM 18671 TaxID=1291743 RepID=A0A081BHB8_9LACO|nr:DNA primase [Secundilactobacillus oryzae]GAK47436.1 DNA primase [Secundilactobacillus oryzae JCM 18671]